MRKITRKALAATAVAATTVALTATPALAANQVRIQYGGDIQGTNSGVVTGYGMTYGSSLQCTQSVATGETAIDSSASSPYLDSTVSAVGAATLDSVSFSSPGANANDWCLTNGFLPTQVTAENLPWTFDALPGGTGATTLGKLNNVKFTLSAPSAPCYATIGGPGTNGTGGYIDGEYLNPSTLTGNDAELSVSFGAGNNLRAIDVHDDNPSDGTDNCAGLIQEGETVALVATYTLQRTGPVPPAAGISPTITYIP
ncbi:hypothetical protein ABZ806_20555 [Spirillospora sp. NPDC047418]